MTNIVNVEYTNFRSIYKYVDNDQNYNEYFHKGHGFYMEPTPYVFEFANVDVTYETGIFFRKKIVETKIVYRKTYSDANPSWKFLENGDWAIATMNLDSKGPNDVKDLIELQQVNKLFKNEYWNKGEVI